MIALLCFLSIAGVIACSVLTVINLIRKKATKSAALGIAICFVIFVICLVMTPEPDNDERKEEVKQTEVIEQNTSKDKNEVEKTDDGDNTSELMNPTEEEKSEKQSEETEAEKESEEVAIKEYDSLQKVFLAITKDTTEEALVTLIDEYGLEYTVKGYNGTPKTNSYKLAYEQDIALQRYADSGDYIKISFNKEDGSLMYAEYFNDISFKNAILYCYGTYWDFREIEPNNNYSGYYYYKPGETKGGITMEYSNGNSTETGYHKVNSVEEALANVMQ